FACNSREPRNGTGRAGSAGRDRPSGRRGRSAVPIPRVSVSLSRRMPGILPDRHRALGHPLASEPLSCQAGRPDLRPSKGNTMTGPAQLSPSQREAYNKLMAALPASSVFELRAKTGRGRTTVLQALHGALGGALITLRDFVEALDKRHPLAMEESYYSLVLD